MQVVASSAKYPGGLAGADGFWSGLVGAVDLQRRVPLERWDWDAYYTADITASTMTINAPFGAFCDGVATFDTSLFGLSTGEAVTIDPQQRQLLEQTAEALQQARPAMAAATAGAGLTGVYVGCMYNEWVDVMVAHGLKLVPRHTPPRWRPSHTHCLSEELGTSCCFLE